MKRGCVAKAQGRREVEIAVWGKVGWHQIIIAEKQKHNLKKEEKDGRAGREQKRQI